MALGALSQNKPHEWCRPAPARGDGYAGDSLTAKRQINQPRIYANGLQYSPDSRIVSLRHSRPVGSVRMSTDASTDAREEDDADLDPTNYDAMLDTLDVAIDEARYKVENGRVRSPENEKVRIKWVRALAYAVNVRRQVANDRDLQELAEEVEALKSEREGGTGL